MTKPILTCILVYFIFANVKLHFFFLLAPRFLKISSMIVQVPKN